MQQLVLVRQEEQRQQQGPLAWTRVLRLVAVRQQQEPLAWKRARQLVGVGCTQGQLVQQLALVQKEAQM